MQPVEDLVAVPTGGDVRYVVQEHTLPFLGDGGACHPTSCEEPLLLRSKQHALVSRVVVRLTEGVLGFDQLGDGGRPIAHDVCGRWDVRSEEHTSELQSRGHIVCRLLLEKKKQH